MVIGMALAASLLLSACGSSTKTLPSAPRVPLPITITGQVSNSRVLVSPTTFGAGPINLDVTNAADHSVTLTVQNAGGVAVAAVQSINPQTPGVVKFDISPGDYAVVTSQHGIRPARLHVGHERASAPLSALEP